MLYSDEIHRHINYKDLDVHPNVTYTRQKSTFHFLQVCENDVFSPTNLSCQWRLLCPFPGFFLGTLFHDGYISLQRRLENSLFSKKPLALEIIKWFGLDRTLSIYSLQTPARKHLSILLIFSTTVVGQLHVLKILIPVALHCHQ